MPLSRRAAASKLQPSIILCNITEFFALRWNDRASRFPSEYQPCNTLLTERILPLPRASREKIIDLFCHEQTKEAVRRNRQDEDCLIRPYIGRRTRSSTPKSRFFTLRNKPLCVNQLESINLPVEEYTKAMAETLAIIYWYSKTDANDMEFVIAPGRADGGSFNSEVLGRHSLWILDFDCVRAMSQDEKGIDQAVSAFMRNDPFWPRPGSEAEADQRLWKIFRKRFLEASELIFGAENELPQMFIDRLEVVGRERRQTILALREK